MIEHYIETLEIGSTFEARVMEGAVVRVTIIGFRIDQNGDGEAHAEFVRIKLRHVVVRLADNSLEDHKEYEAGYDDLLRQLQKDWTPI
jgi:hypothetical protein